MSGQRSMVLIQVYISVPIHRLMGDIEKILKFIRIRDLFFFCNKVHIVQKGTRFNVKVLCLCI